ncbi:hypothetical protein CLAFUW4_08207 [Fulvia fulva]|uniref:Uncharacterized protein n=1 Tax=Passalora fulva TaxID=5499 RepID=A0A9Q8LCH8_PASFU|nr:uncharacterized protein CLAFUR5_08319 [Fulvia fulva]KAK4629398.1 hypothetical protein CLAFUR4_08212 [Fulvia fulva]KAK4630545.1 hypothetical protein CLAFUR0_08207 [Fulvia fulva]UJO14877.1 hypothetical protein CLAFUR5_08319 [Fulvia fulva]WPV12311.1 hypothetical protein CLAFUW4_08207 [Fulvia fulva]WPV27124.1 hypothetical protein CLAFUW7_08207 [Fulvia fulva]
MAPSTRGKEALEKKIATLQLRLAPLVPLPGGLPPHPDFPKTLMAFHLLTEDQLDSIAHYYHQSTPGPFTNNYPANMNWDKEFLARRESRTPTTPSARERRHSKQLSQEENIWLEDLMNTVEDLQAPTAKEGEGIANGSNPYAGLTEKERIRIKRRKVGKFIGLVGMETPVEEIAGRIQNSLDRAVERSREELRRNEEVMLRRRKMA